MHYGLYLAASGSLTNLHRMDVLANNLANAETPGFKPLSWSTRQRDVARVEDQLPNLPSSELLERLGGGVMLMPARVSSRQGTPETTGRPLDLAVDGPGFLVVRQGAGLDADSLRFSRDGRLSLNARGVLVQATTGLPVLDAVNNTIRLDPSQPVSIDAQGTIRQGNAAVARLQLAVPPSTDQLRPEGNGLFSVPGTAMSRRRPAEGQFIPGAFERSAVDPVRTMLNLGSAERAAGSSTRMIQYFDQLMDRAVNGLGRTVA
jgi:flagellar basal-body rod protein FlgG